MISDTVQLNEQKPRSLRKEIFIFYALFAAAIYFVYIKTHFALPFFIILLVLSWFSKRNYFWIAFFFLIGQAPGWFFLYTPTSHMPTIKLFTGVSIQPIDFFTVLMLFKAMVYKKHISLKLHTPFLLLLIYFSFSFFSGTIFYSISWDAQLYFLRSTFYTVWIIFFVAFIEDKDTIFKFFRLLFPVLFFILFCQIYFLISGTEFINRFDPFARGRIIRNTLTGELRSMPGGQLVVLLNYIGALFFLEFKEKILSKMYLYLIVSTCFLSIVLSSTRSFFGLLLFIFIGVYFNQIKRIPKILLTALLVLIPLLSLTKLGVFSEEYLKNSIVARLSQAFDFIAGKGGEIDTFISRTAQLKILFSKIEDNLLFGYGFSDISLDYYNDNWGFFNTVLMFGVFGLALFIFLFISYFRMMLIAQRKLSPNNLLRESIRVLMISFLAMLGGYCFTWDFFSLVVPSTIVYMMTFFGISEILIKSLSQEKRG